MMRVRPRSLRGRAILFFGAGSLAVAALFALSTYLLARGYLLKQRDDAVERRAAIDARLVTARLDTAGTEVADVLNTLDPLSASAVLVHKSGQWFSSSLDVGAEAVPSGLLSMVSAGVPGYQVANSPDGPVAVVGVPMPAVGGQLFEVAPLGDLASSLDTLATILVVGSLVATAAGVGIGLWASRRVLHPLDELAGAAAEIAGGELSRRIGPTDDPDLVTIVGSFNSMVDALQGRIERDARFAGDVSHELRTPLTTLVASVDILQARRAEMSTRQQQALDLVVAELNRFRRLLDELIELARFDAGLSDHRHAEPTDVYRLLGEALEGSGRPVELLHGIPGAMVCADKRQLERAFLNLMDNADRYGGGLVAVGVLRYDSCVSVYVDDIGPGVPAADRERVFARFATSGGGRGSTRGTGLGLAIVAETATSVGGDVSCVDRPGGGARFVVRLPVAEVP
jgi:two-component system, OmpR family, sensor histidine kinase MtrB